MRRVVRFSGRVQGVGFRWTTRRVASGFNVAGTVENLRDGRVELVLEGAPAEATACVAAVEAAMEGHIDLREAEDGPPQGLSGFRILR